MKPEGTIGLHYVCQSVRPFRQSVCHTRFPDFSSLCFHISGWKLVASFYMKTYRSSLTFVMSGLIFFFMSFLPFVQNSVCHTRFPDFSSLCFYRFGWKFVASFYMKSYRPSSTFVTVDLLFMSNCPLFKIMSVTFVFPTLVADLNLLLGPVGDLYCF